jgi:two-component system sensor histidine kinase RegB
MTERLEGWRALRPDVTLTWLPHEGQDPHVVLDTAFWPALFNLINNAAEAGGGQVGVGAHYLDGVLGVDIVNREGCLTDAQLRAAGLGLLHSGKPAGLGLGVMLSHATLARLGGNLTLDNRPAGGVHARITLPLKERPL